MKTAYAFLAGVALAAAGCGSPTTSGGAKPDSALRDEQPPKDKGASLLGSWELVSAERDGKAVELHWKKLDIEDYKFRYNSPMGIEERPAKMSAEKAPGTYTLQIPDQNGIFKIEGDKLYLSEGKPDAKAPTEFSSKPGTDHTYMVLKRVAK